MNSVRSDLSFEVMHINIIFLLIFLFVKEITFFRGGSAVKPNEGPWGGFVRNSDQSSDNKICNTVESRFKKESQFKKDCWYHQFFST